MTALAPVVKGPTWRPRCTFAPMFSPSCCMGWWTQISWLCESSVVFLAFSGFICLAQIFYITLLHKTPDLWLQVSASVSIPGWIKLFRKQLCYVPIWKHIRVSLTVWEVGSFTWHESQIGAVFVCLVSRTKYRFKVLSVDWYLSTSTGYRRCPLQFPYSLLIKISARVTSID